jgi:inner membrane protein involved in colicin E2 resistance
MIMPARIQPGELAQSLSFSAPISLLFFFLVIAVLAKLRNLDIHPVNYFFLGAAFFAFHLLFAYSVDHLPIAAAFALSSVVSVAMVTCYLRLVVSQRFAFVEAGLAQLVYLVGFSMAHFLEGFTGLTLTVLSVATLFLLMLLTGRIRWSRVLGEKSAPENQSGAPTEAWPSAVG